MVKDLLDDDLDGHVIYFCGETANIVRPDAKICRPVVGMPVISVKIGDHCYHGLCDMGASASAIPHSLYKLGLLEMLKSCAGRLNTLLTFLFLVPHNMIFVPLFLVDPS